jgi:hypothetical protein
VTAPAVRWELHGDRVLVHVARRGGGRCFSLSLDEAGRLAAGLAVLVADRLPPPARPRPVLVHGLDTDDRDPVA